MDYLQRTYAPEKESLHANLLKISINKKVAMWKQMKIGHIAHCHACYNLKLKQRLPKNYHWKATKEHTRTY